MKTKLIIFITLIFVNSCFAITIQLRKGGTASGEIVSKDEETLVLNTSDGEETFKWKQLKSKCIKEKFPEIYEKLKAAAIERRKKKDEEKNSGKNGKTEAPDFSKICIGITTTEKSGTFKKENSDKKMKVNKFSKIIQGILKINFRWLDKNKTYMLKTIFTHHLKHRKKFEKSYNETRPSDKDLEKIEMIKNVTSFEKKYLSSPYHGYKIKARKGYHWPGEGGKKKSIFGYESDGWDIAVFLDDKLIYKEEKGKEPKYFIVNKL